MPAAVEVDERLQSDLRRWIGRGSSGSELLGEVVVGVYVSLMVFAVVELHDLARDGGLKSAIIICIEVKTSIESFKGDWKEGRYMVDLGG